MMKCSFEIKVMRKISYQTFYNFEIYRYLKMSYNGKEKVLFQTMPVILPIQVMTNLTVSFNSFKPNSYGSNFACDGARKLFSN